MLPHRNEALRACPAPSHFSQSWASLPSLGFQGMGQWGPSQLPRLSQTLSTGAAMEMQMVAAHPMGLGAGAVGPNLPCWKCPPWPSLGVFLGLSSRGSLSEPCLRVALGGNGLHLCRLGLPSRGAVELALHPVPAKLLVPLRTRSPGQLTLNALEQCPVPRVRAIALQWAKGGCDRDVRLQGLAEGLPELCCRSSHGMRTPRLLPLWFLVEVAPHSRCRTGPHLPCPATPTQGWLHLSTCCVQRIWAPSED